MVAFSQVKFLIAQFVVVLFDIKLLVANFAIVLFYFKKSFAKFALRLIICVVSAQLCSQVTAPVSMFSTSSKLLVRMR